MMQPPSARERLVYTLFNTGLRTGEVLGLRWGAVDLRAGTLTVRISRSRGEDNPPTTKNSQRTITLPPMWSRFCAPPSGCT